LRILIEEFHISWSSGSFRIFVLVYKSYFNRSYSLVTQKVDEIYVVPSQVTSSKKIAMADGDFGGTSHLPETVRKVID
jgi:hypothetical protein